MKFFFFFFVLLFVSMQSYSQNQSIVRVHSYIQRIDEYAPWKRLPISKETFSAIAIEPQKLLVTASAVRFTKYLELSLISKSQRIPLKIDYVDYNVQLAILSFEGDYQLKPLELSEDIKINTRVKFKVIKKRKLIDLNTRVREIRTIQSATANYNVPVYVSEVKQKNIGQSDPVFREGKLVGFAIRRNKNNVFSLPISLIRKFIENSKKNEYGFVRLGFAFDKLSSKALRKYVNAQNYSSGVWITRVHQNSPFFGKLKEGDILLRVGNYNIDDQGLARVGKWGKMSLSGATYQFAPHKDLVLRILRKGKEILLTSQPKPFKSGVEAIPYLSGENRNFTILGGLVFIELTQNYLMSWGKNWSSKAPLHLLYRLLYKNTTDEDRVVLLSKVIADKYNRGYSKLSNIVVEKINSNPVKTIAELNQIVSESKDFIRISLGPIPREIVLDHDGIDEANDRISKAYSVPREYFSSTMISQ